MRQRFINTIKRLHGIWVIVAVVLIMLITGAAYDNPTMVDIGAVGLIICAVRMGFGL